ncbi:MAG: cobyrinic acid a,c-diamide synthase [Methanospirillaceae archaeon]|nr:cobyrinic acid a,c-diamide synthase [Methanospirillaceae archaeon]
MGYKIAVCGKGGVGKTFIAGALACRYVSLGFRTLAIDADSSPNLALTLGFDPGRAESITPIAENEDLIREKTDTGYPGVFSLTFSVEDIIFRYTTPVPCGVQLLVMGTVRGMGTGCACPANSLVRTLTRHLVLDRDEVVIMDMEAGIEHLGRGTAEHVDTLLVVTDAHQVSLLTAGRIADIARNAGLKNIFFLGNRVAGGDHIALIQDKAARHECPLITTIPYDPLVLNAGILGTSPLSLKESPALAAIAHLPDLLNDEQAPGGIS